MKYIVAFVVAVCLLAGARDKTCRRPGFVNTRGASGLPTVTWTIFYEHGLQPCGADEDKVYAGCTNCNTRTIVIDQDLPVREVAITLRHEVFHVVTNCAVKDQSLHDSIYELSTWLQQFEEDNPDYVAFVSQKCVALAEPPTCRTMPVEKQP